MSEIKYLMDQIESAANSFNTYSDRKDAYTEQFMKATAEMLRIVTEELEALKKQAVQNRTEH
jgi:hypothetical protein